MARKPSSTAVQEELYPPSGSREEYPQEQDARAHYDEREPAGREFDSSRVVDFEAEQESPFLRGQKRVSVRRGSLPKKTVVGLQWFLLAALVLALLGVAGAAVYSYGKHSWRFRIDSSDQIEVTGSQHVSHAQIMEVMGGDIGRNIFFVPLSQRKQQLEQIPWVESASVMRFVPNRLRIEIHERTPVAFARIGAHVSLIDAGGNLMELTPGPKRKYSFPVITGMNANEPLSTRAVRMKNYKDLIDQLDSSGAHYSQDISEVDLTDPEDVKIMTADQDGGVVVHLGNGGYLQRYKIYVTHVQAWRQQFTKLDSVDLRYDGQIIVNPDLDGISRQPALTPTAAKAAVAAGVKDAAIVNYEKYVSAPAPPPAANKQPVSKASATAKHGPSTTKAAAKAAATHSAQIHRNERRAAQKNKSKPSAVAISKPTPVVPAPAPNAGSTATTAKAPVTSKSTPAPTPKPSSAKTPSPKTPSPKTPSPKTPSPKTPSPKTPPLKTSSPNPSSSSNQSQPNPSSLKSSPSQSTSSAVAGTQKKPSAAIPKETPQN